MQRFLPRSIYLDFHVPRGVEHQEFEVNQQETKVNYDQKRVEALLGKSTSNDAFLPSFLVIFEALQEKRAINSLPTQTIPSPLCLWINVLSI